MSSTPKGRWLVRLGLAIAAPVLSFLLLEGTLRLLRCGHPTTFFIADEAAPGYLRSNPEFTTTFLPKSFGIRPLNFRLRREKPEGTFRVIVVGESAAQGTPEPSLGAAPQLRVRLETAAHGKKVEVVNLAITAINSHVIHALAGEIPDLSPDLVVVYMGNNEVIGPYGPGSGYLDTVPPLWAIRLAMFARSTRTGQWLRSLVDAANLRREGKAPEWRGMGTFTGHLVTADDPRLTRVYAHFAQNLQDLLETASAAKIPVVLSTVVANFKDHSPFASVHRVTLGEKDRLRHAQLLDAATREWRLGRFSEARALLAELLVLDPTYSDTHYLLGRVELAEGKEDAARLSFAEALHRDGLRFRPDAAINTAIREAAARFPDSVVLVDAANTFGADALSKATPAGDETLFEHVHLNWAGNLRLSRLWAEAATRAKPQALDVTKLGDDARVAEALAFDASAEEAMVHAMIELTSMPPFTGQRFCGERQVRLKSRSWVLRGEHAGEKAFQATKERLVTELARRPDDPYLLLRRSSCEEERKNPGEALTFLDRAARLEPESPLLLTRRASLLAALGKQEEARGALARAVQLDPYFLPGWHAVVDSWCAARLYREAEKQLEIPLSLMPGNHFLRMAYARFLLRSGNPGAAEQELRSLLREDPANSAALRQLSTLLTQRGAVAEAEHFEIAHASLQPTNDANNLRVFRHLVAQGKETEALEPLLALAENAPADPALFMDLARRLAAAKRTDDARVYATKAQTLAAQAGAEDLASSAKDLLSTLPAPSPIPPP